MLRNSHSFWWREAGGSYPQTDWLATGRRCFLQNVRTSTLTVSPMEESLTHPQSPNVKQTQGPSFSPGPVCGFTTWLSPSPSPPHCRVTGILSWQSRFKGVTVTKCSSGCKRGTAQRRLQGRQLLSGMKLSTLKMNWSLGETSVHQHTGAKWKNRALAMLSGFID